MRISIRCYASLSRFTPAEAEAYPLEPGDTPASVVARLGIAPEDLKLVFVNGVHAQLDAVLADGDRVGLFPAVGGG